MTNAVPIVAGSSVRQQRFDWTGFAALSIYPAVATFQGVVAAVGIWAPFPRATEALIAIVVILVALVARIRLLPAALVNPMVGRASLYLVAYLLVIVASTLLVYLDPIERDPSKMFQQLLSTIPAVLVFFVMVASPGPAQTIRALRASMLVWAIAAVVTPLTALTPLPIGEVQGVYAGSQAVRSFGVLSDGGTFVISFLAVAYFASRRLFWFLLCMFALILSGSRTPFLIAGAGIAVVLLFVDPVGGRRVSGERAFKALLSSLVLVLLLLALQLAFSQVSEQLGVSNAFERLRDTDIGQNDRLFSMSRGLQWFQESPVNGHGFNSYYYFSLRSATFGANQSNALNQIVQTLMDGGLVAMLLLAMFFLKVVWSGGGRKLIDRRNDPYALKAWLLVFIIVNQTAVFILPAFFLTALVFGLAGVSLHLEATGKSVLAPSFPSLRSPRVPAAR